MIFLSDEIKAPKLEEQFYPQKEKSNRNLPAAVLMERELS